jgi:SWI/SNF-related matrix-associated actin-dependent regulator of chromatin subfamily A3
MPQLDAKLHCPEMERRGNKFVFSLHNSIEHIVVRFYDATEFAILNTQLAKALRGVIDQPSILLEVFADTIATRDIIRKAKKASDALVRININVYGPLQLRDMIATHLTAHKVWLQHPEDQQQGTLYDNPHTVKFVDLPEADSSFLEMPNGDPEVMVTEHERFKQDISHVYASLTRDSQLKTVEGDSRITPLLP